MRTLTGRQYAAAAATAVLLLTAAGCGGDKADNASGEPTSTVTPTGTTDPTPTETAGTELDPAEFASLVTGAFDKLTTAHLSMQIDASSGTISATGVVDYTRDAATMALKMTLPGSGGIVDMRLLGQVMYMSLPESAGVGEPGKFYKIDLNDSSSPLAAQFGDLTSFDPKSTFDSFTTGVTKVVELGAEDLDGDATTHYQVTTSTAALKKTLPKAQRDLVPDAITYDLWLDSDNRLRQMVTDMPGTGQMTMAMTHWGEPVDISAPPANKVVTLPSS